MLSSSPGTRIVARGRLFSAEIRGAVGKSSTIRNRLSAALRNPKARQAKDRSRWLVYLVSHPRCQLATRCKFGRLIELLLGLFDLSGLSSNLRARAPHHQSNHQSRKSNRRRKERKDENDPATYMLVKKLATTIKRNFAS